MIIVKDPGNIICTTPFIDWQMAIDKLFNSGPVDVKIVGAPGIHGAEIAGRQGPGLPAFIVGCCGDEHNPIGRTFKKGLLCMIDPMGPDTPIVSVGGTAVLSGTGAAEKIHLQSDACEQAIPIIISP
ncbi:MAG: hypothetical protein CNLJKLNK_00577 [Holosporales bacterium]